MADIKSPEDRSFNMSRIRSKDTKPEEYVRKLLHRMGFRYRKNARNIPGHPDAWFAKYNVALFVNGCFWHRHDNCKYASMPKSRVEFWQLKFEKNIERDKKVRDELTEKGIRVLVIWECTTKRMRKSLEVCNSVVEEVNRFFHSDGYMLEL